MASGRFEIRTLGKPALPNPISSTERPKYVSQSDRILYDPSIKSVEKAFQAGETPESFEMAGPREHIFFPPARTKAAIVTCGGLCPGINSVIRGLVMQLWYRYQVRNIIGIPYGYGGLGLQSPYRHESLTPEQVLTIHERGGSFLGSSRGTPPVGEIVDSLQRSNINILFVIGGDGTMRGAQAIAQEITQRNLQISIVGIPKTIDNDIPFVKRSFGFETAVSIAAQAALSGHNEAQGTPNGIGLVRLMGRNSGYIAANTTLATGHANFCLIPEVDFSIEGESGLLKLIHGRMKARRNHTLIIVAEGAGQKYFKKEDLPRDASGNLKHGDIGLFLKENITTYFQEQGIPTSVKYIDPSYLIRSAPANPADNLLCASLAKNAVHAAMAGRTAMLIGFWHGKMTHVPLSALEGESQKILPNGDLWFNVLETTGQPAKIG